MANTFPHDWASQHRLVISQGATKHTIYLGYSDLEPVGKFIACHHQACSKGHLMPVSSGKKKVTVTCRRCRSWCKVQKVHLDTTTPLGHQMLVSTEYPQEQAETEWRVKPIAPQTSLQALGPQTTVPTIKGN